MDGTVGKRSYLLAFDSTHAALAAQKALAGYSPQVIPTPREISAGCGMALRLFAADDGQAQAIMQAAALDEDAADLYLYEAGVYLPLARPSR